MHDSTRSPDGKEARSSISEIFISKQRPSFDNLTIAASLFRPPPPAPLTQADVSWHHTNRKYNIQNLYYFISHMIC
jgi:hypothetical protein